MSTYDDSSLFLYPSGYKASVLFAQKPMDANGQLDFTRSNDTATRVASNGLIERVRTNLVPQSNTFSNATWNKVNATVTSGQSGYDGTSNAWLLTDDATVGAHSVTQFTRWATTLQTGSVYVKAGTNTKAYIGNATTNRGAFFNLSTGTLEGTIGTVVSQSIVSVGSGWYRISVTLEGAGTFIIGSYQTFVSGNFPSSIAYSGSGSNILIQNSQLEAGDIATQYIDTTTTAVSVGPLANIPRIDYLGGGCGKLLLEPQRTNLQTFSENIDNAVYGKTNVTISTNATTSPDGYSNADKIVENTTNAVHRISGFGGVMSSGTTYTSSFFAKKAERDQVYILIPTSVAATRTVLVFNLTTGVSSVVSGSSATSHSMVDYGNGWYRCIVTFTTTAVGTNLIGIYNGAEDYAGTTDFGLFLYGLMNEAGSYASSYVNTLAASVTRGADSCSKTGISSLIGQTEGTMFVEGTIVANDSGTNRRIISISDNTTLNQIQIFNRLNTSKLECDGNVSGVTQFSFQSSDVGFNTTFKAAVAYKENDIAFYVNGVQIGTDTSASIPATSRLAFSRGDLLFPHEGNINQAILFKTRLPNSELAALTL